MNMKAETKGILIDVGAVALGGVVNMVAEYVTSKYISQASYSIGSVTFYAADVAGVGSAVAEIAVGKVMKKYRVILFGAGGLAASLAVIVGKALLASPFTLTARSPAMFYPQLSTQSARYDIAPARKGNYR